MKKILIKKEDWMWELSRKTYLIWMYCASRSFFLMPQWLFKGTIAPIYDIKDNNSDIYLNKKDLEKASKDVFGKIFIDKTIITRILSDFEKTREKSLELIEEIKKIKEYTSDKELLEMYEKMTELYSEMFVFGNLPRIINKEGQIQLENYLKNNLKDNKKVIEALNILTSTTKDSYVAKGQLELIKIGIDLEKGKDICSLMKKYTEEFEWIPIGYYDEKPYDKKYFFEELEKLKKQELSFKEKLKLMEKSKIELEEEKEALISKISNGMKNISLAMSEMTFLKDYVKEIIVKFNFYSEKLFVEIAKKIKKDTSFVKMMTPEEVKVAILNKKINEEAIKKRFEHCVIFYECKEPCVLTGEGAEEIEDSLKEEIKEINEIEGVAASLGHAIGKAKIILSQKDFSKIEKGDILVSVMTTPDFVPLMEKASAIVTDEGGLTCHAAIIAREMNKPCVIGTKVATKVFKDGEIIEVKANHGIVRRVGK